ncbi:hypothetical protein [Pseudomonas sp. 273]|uniref:hypothetical protein n=1 Tax=Pseudomonas sp. 273 TaxID=75692 RepID=UPI0023D8188C|nr:hypothetical protein [Pseudomonas sp. 273]
MSAIDIEYLRGWVGREQSVQDQLALFPARALAAALDRESLPEVGDELPPAWQWLYFHDTPLQRDLGPDGHPRTGGFLPPVPLPRRMWAAGEFASRRPLLLGRDAERRSVVTSVELKRGSSGTLVFVSLEHNIQQDGRPCLFERQHLVYREMPTGPGVLPGGQVAPVDADFRVPFVPDPVLLFRYSALTYNAHRIHYDHAYATGYEHYPALVVHGPLLATLLREQASRQLPEQRLTGLEFRALRPSFVGDRLQLCGRREGDTLELWAENQDGYLTMTATLGVMA